MENPVKSIKAYLTQYVNLRFTELRLEGLERLVNVLGFFIFGAFIFFLSLLIFGFAAFGLAEWLCYMLDSRTAGYFAVAGVVFVFVILLFLFKKAILSALSGKILWEITKPREKKQEEEDDVED